MKRAGPLKRRTGLKPSGRPRQKQPGRDWADARAKVVREGVCRICGAKHGLQAAHTIGRAFDDLRTVSKPNGQVRSFRYVDPDSIVPLCDPFVTDCHGRYDRGEIDLLGKLTVEEEIDAVKRAGGLEKARIRLCPTAYRKIPDVPEKT